MKQGSTELLLAGLEAAGVAAVVTAPAGERALTAAARRVLGGLADDVALERSAAELGLGLRCLQLPDGTALALLDDHATRRGLLRIALHDLRSPMANVRTYAALLARGKMPADKVPRTIEALSRNADHALALVSLYIEGELAELGPLAVDKHPADVGQVLDRALAAERPMAAERGVRLEWVAVGAEVAVDSERLAQAVSAVLERAIARTPPEGVVRAHIEEGEKSVALVIHDGGEAPSHEELDFDRATRAVAENKLMPAIALSLARAVVEAHGGRLELHAERGGAAWRLVLPR